LYAKNIESQFQINVRYSAQPNLLTSKISHGADGSNENQQASQKSPQRQRPYGFE
jgi:hypothetical protein